MTLDLNSLTLPALFTTLCGSGEGLDLSRRLLTLALEEDIQSGDITSDVLPDPRSSVLATLRAREPLTLAGLAAIPALLAIRGGASIEPIARDGDQLDAGADIATLSGPVADILTIERTLLNLLARLSGVATHTSSYVTLLPADAKARIFDTRKTTPGMRRFEKYAVRCGGGYCHRLDLSDALLIKDNHIASIADEQLPSEVRRMAEQARRIAESRGTALRFVMVEVDRIEQFEALLAIPDGVIDIVLLDNMPPDTMKGAVGMRDKARKRIELEASGGITRDTIAHVALSGIDRISIGSLTRGARVVDIGLDIDA